MSKDDPVVEEMLYQAVDDWVALTTVIHLVKSEQEAWWRSEGEPGDEDVRAATLTRIEFLLDNGLMKVGELSSSTEDPSDFLDWPGTTKQVLEYIDEEWEHLTSLAHFEPCWLRATEAGLEAGRSIE